MPKSGEDQGKGPDGTSGKPAPPSKTVKFGLQRSGEVSVEHHPAPPPPPRDVKIHKRHPLPPVPPARSPSKKDDKG